MNRPGFLTKARLRRLLMSDDVWSFRRKRHPAEFAPDEDAVVPAQGAEGQQNEPDEPDLPARYPCHSQAQHQVRDERQLASAAQTPGHQVRDERQLASAAQMPGHQRDPNNTSHPTGQETNPARFSPSLLDQRVLRRPSPKNDQDRLRAAVSAPPDQVPVCGFRTRPVVLDRPDRAPAPHPPPSRARESLSSDCETTSGHQASESAQEMLTITLNNLSDVNTDSSETETDTASLNVRNNQRSQNVLSLNNNHENRVNLATSDPERPLPLPPPPPPPLAASTAEGPNTHTHTHPPETSMRGAVLVNTPSVDSGSELQKTACDSSPSGADNMSSLSLSTESLGSSEEDSHGDKIGGHPHRCGSQRPSYEPCCGHMGFREERLAQPDEPCCGHMGFREERLAQPDEPCCGRMGFRDWEERLAQPDDDGEKVLDSLLSEILSPVDEVLSYGSAELPPSARGAAGTETVSASFSLPPAPPAYEVITWTSEEDLLPPPGPGPGACR
ncbi:uncharacterized protein LOC125294156 isoform X2 [Alosa alosa]|uniref:uncharacterized protein LOC125294156 isoform X2 n=1 Tax=Alosa alosa TaxID=278164 RepID=UPI002015357D|nr:uncharacterized protein LOC125294156 isoform X2 [Alosa alosa]